MSRTILCVDDSVTMQKVAEITFEATDFTCVGARNADDGLAAAKSNKPVLILADAVMPGKTGYDLCQALKSDPELRSIPVLIMCGNSQPYDPARGEGAGADGHVVKPWDTQVMLDKITEVLEVGPSARDAAAPQPVASSGSAATRPPAPPPGRPAPPPMPKPASPAALAGGGVEPPRSATIMGMPSLKLPAPEFGNAAPVAPMPPAAPPRPAMPAPVAKSAPPMAPPSVAPPRPAPARPAPPVAAKAPPAPAAPPAPRAPVAPPAPVAAVPAAAPPAPSRPIPTMPRPPMIKGTPSRRPALAAVGGAAVAAVPDPIPEPIPNPRSSPVMPPMADIADIAAAKTREAAAGVASSAGLDPAGPEMAAIVKLSREVVEQVVWEVVPELAETIIREHLAKNGLPSGAR